jgi:predicted phage baseplate assembly protein
VNGRKPGAGAEIYVSYAVCRAEQGNVARGRRWKVAGFPGTFGVNPDPITGGAERTNWDDLRRDARRHVSDDHPLVSAADVEAAALDLRLLEVARAWIVSPVKTRTGTVTLIVLRARYGAEPPEPPESARWLDAVRRRLAGRMPLGTRLVVAAPRYVEFSVRADVEVEPGRDPEAIVKEVKQRLRERFALVQGGSTPAWRPGVPVTRADVAAWILGVPGVLRTTTVELVEGGAPKPEISVPRVGLPRIDVDGSPITARRPGGEPRT